MHAELASQNHCAVPFLSCVVVNLSWYDNIIFTNAKDASLNSRFELPKLGFRLISKIYRKFTSYTLVRYDGVQLLLSSYREKIISSLGIKSLAIRKPYSGLQHS